MNTALTWYCGLYQCFRSQSHKIIWKIQDRHIKCHSNGVFVYVFVHNTEYRVYFAWKEHKNVGLCCTFQHTALWLFSEGTGRSETSSQLLVYSACYLNTQYGYVAPHDALSTTGMHTALVTAVWGLSLRAKEEKQTTKTTIVRLQWSYEILSDNNYVNRQHFHAICW